MSTDNKKVYSYLGLAARGRRLVSGEFSVEQAIKNGSAFVVLIAADASDNTRKKFVDACSYRNVKYFMFSDKELLGHSIGKESRAVVAITDEGFGSAVIRCFDNGGIS